MLIKIVSTEDLKRQRDELQKEAKYWCDKIVRYNTIYSGKVLRSKTSTDAKKWLHKLMSLNTRYYHRIRKIDDKINKINKKLGEKY